MKFLLDTNILIPLEPTRPSDIEQGSEMVADMLQAINRGNHQVYIHPASIEELRGDQDKQRRAMRDVLLRKYQELPAPPDISLSVLECLGTPSPGSHDEVDYKLLAALEKDAADFLITEDRTLRARGNRLGLGERIADPDEALAFIRSLFPVKLKPPPAVNGLLAHELDESDPIFMSLRSDYEEFDDWLRKCKREHRNAWVIQAIGDGYDGLAIVKEEDPREYGISGQILKVCTFIIAEKCRGLRFGELLLKTIFGFSLTNNYDNIFVEVYEKHSTLVSLLEDFGFYEHEEKSSKGELVLIKNLRPSVQERDQFSPFEFHKKFGPNNVKFETANCYVIPIKPHYHRMLFPDAEPQLELIQGNLPYGNSLRKAYLCHSPIRKLEIGDILFFYLTRPKQTLTTVGVIENVFVSSDTDEIVQAVAKRTVYSYEDIENLCRKDVLVISFRQAIIIDQSVTLQALIESDVLKTAPQSIVSLSEEGEKWLVNHLKLQHLSR